MPKTVKLAKPITVMGDGATKELTEITFRDPTTADIRAMGGLPFRFFTHKDGRGENEINVEKMFRYLAHLSNTTTKDIESLSLDQYSEAEDWLQGALTPTAKKKDGEELSKN